MSWVTERLAGRRLLLVTEHNFAAGYLRDVLAASGAEIVEIADSDADTLPSHLAAGPIDALVVDFAIGRAETLRLLDASDRARVPALLVLSTDAVLPGLLGGVPVLRQPFAGFELVDRLSVLLHPSN